MKTIKLIPAVFFLFLAVLTKAQDVIIFKTGDELKAKVTEVALNAIKYKKADNPNGPLYTTPKAEVFMIKYENGTKDVFTAPSFNAPKAQFDKHQMPSDKPMDYESYRHLYRKKLVGGIVMTALGAPLIIPGLALSIAGLVYIANPTPYYGNGYNNGYYNNNGGDGLAISGVVLLAAGIPLTVAGAVKIKSARQIKRKANELKATMSFNPILAPENYGHTGNFRAGAGMRINF